MTIRLASSLLLPLLTCALVTACSDDGNGTTDAMIDADPPGDCGCTDPPADAMEPIEPVGPFSRPEGGEFRLERFQLGADDGDAALAAQALFFEGQNPPARSLDGKLITIRQELRDKGYWCGDFRDGNNFDNGKSPAAQAVADSRAYFDVGATATLTHAEDETEVITLGRFRRSDDAAAATDRSSGLVHEILYKAPETTQVARNARYLPAIMGSEYYETLELKYGKSAPGEELADENGEGTAQLFMPSAFTLTSPAEADFYTAGALVFTRGQDLEITYTLAAPAPEGWPTIMPFLSFVNDAGMVEAYCLKLTRGVPEDGLFTVPHEVLEYVQPDPGGHAVFGRLAHVAWEAQPLETRLDLIGIESKVSPGFVVQDAPPANQ